MQNNEGQIIKASVKEELGQCKIATLELSETNSFLETMITAEKWIDVFNNLAGFSKGALSYELNYSSGRPVSIAFSIDYKIAHGLANALAKISGLQSRLVKINEHFIELEKLGIPVSEKGGLYKDRIINHELNEIASLLSAQGEDLGDQAEGVDNSNVFNNLKFIAFSIGDQAKLSFNLCDSKHIENVEGVARIQEVPRQNSEGDIKEESVEKQPVLPENLDEEDHDNNGHTHEEALGFGQM